MIIRIRSENKVMRKASPLAAGFSRFEISHRISSTRTAERATVVEKVMAATRLNVMLRHDLFPWLFAR